MPIPTLWRVFPWNPEAEPGRPFSPSYIPPQSGHGRFDLPRRSNASTCYFAETPEHAVAERIQDLRNRTLFDAALFERGHRLALVSAEVGGELARVDLCDPEELAGRGIAPDRLAYRERDVTRAIADTLHADSGVAGLRWWSAFFGEWHTTALFSDRLEDVRLGLGEPEALHLHTPAVAEAAAALAIEFE